MTISITQPTSRKGRPTARELQRMVASAHPVPPGRAHGSAYELVPPLGVRRIVGAYGTPLFLPARLPGGFIFSQWTLDTYNRAFDGRRTLVVTFGRDGLVLEWGVYAGVDKFGLECPGKHSRLSPKRSTLVNGRRVFFLDGIHGASAWRCIPEHAVGNAKSLEVELWYDIRLDSPAMRRLAMRMVATARLIRAR